MGNFDGSIQPLIRYNLFSQFKGIAHFTTTKQNFLYENPRFTGIPETIKNQNISNLSELTGIEKQRFIFPLQTHSSNIKIIHSLSDNNSPDTDALITDQPGICLCVQTADCVPVLLFCPDKNVVGIVHAGWRGTVGQIGLKTALKMVSVFNVTPEKLLAVIGPSIGPEIYEVGEEVISEVIKNIPFPTQSLKFVSGKKALFNLWTANKNLLVDAGLKPENIEIPEFCTFSDPSNFYSARRDGTQTGRLVSGIMLL